MRILVIEDDHNKAKKICDFLREAASDANINERRAYQSGLKEAITTVPDLIVLDMTMPTYEISLAEKGGRIRPYAGREILSAIKRRKLKSKIVIVTQFESFGEGADVMTLEQLKTKLQSEFPDNYLTTIFYQPSESSWRDHLEQTLNNVRLIIEG
ncbi:hypothetical protein JRI60_41805 [Archangium violaceum]|uniref:hypothetical protein n=1 Tax=Archangium violaceum TaxID=83451 RepID=UPI00194F99D3|nr:hypothetical protein [Archangium violaceum]QRN95533.1 hypothetical protein JRI60_41805 [Archangium violaceum]